MQPEQPNQPYQPPQPAQPIQPEPSVNPVQQPPQPVAVPQQQPAPAMQGVFGQPPVAQPGNSQKMITNAGRSVFVLGIFFVVLFSLGALAGVITSLSTGGEGIIVALLSVLYVLLGVVLITQGKKLKHETDTHKASAMMKSMAVGLSVLAALSLFGRGWLGVVLLGVTAAYLFYVSLKVAKA